jgi:hypothetical protein
MKHGSSSQEASQTRQHGALLCQLLCTHGLWRQQLRVTAAAAVRCRRHATLQCVAELRHGIQ